MDKFNVFLFSLLLLSAATGIPFVTPGKRIASNVIDNINNVFFIV